MIKDFLKVLLVLILRLVASFTEAAFKKADEQEGEDILND
jgi:hypothetical protein